MSVDRVILQSVCADEEERRVTVAESDYDGYVTPNMDETSEHELEIMTRFDLLDGKRISYPIPSAPESDGSYPIYKWFVENHCAYDLKKHMKIGMANSRQQMFYANYMKALDPELKQIVREKLSTRQYQQKEDTSVKKKEVSSKKRTDGPLEIGSVAELEVDRINKKGAVMLKNESGDKRTFKLVNVDPAEVTVGDKLQVKLVSIAGNDYRFEKQG
jgi:hypothetical protein